MSLSRRTFVKTGAVAGFAAAAPALASGESPTLVIYDSALLHSMAFARRLTGARIDIAALHERRWQALRAPLPSGRMTGLTRWTDYLIARGYAEEQGKRLVSERREGGLIAWEMM